MLNKTISKAKEIPLTSHTNNEIPVTPPSIYELGKRKPFKPTHAEHAPNNIKKKSFKRFLISILNESISLNSSGDNDFL